MCHNHRKKNSYGSACVTIMGVEAIKMPSSQGYYRSPKI